MPSQSKTRSKSKKVKSASKQRKLVKPDKSQKKIYKTKTIAKKQNTNKTKTKTKSQSKSQIKKSKGNKKEKTHLVTPVKKKITKGKKSQEKKKPIKKEILKLEVEKPLSEQKSRSPSMQKSEKKSKQKKEPADKKTKKIYKEKVQKPKKIKKTVEKKIKKSKSQEKKAESASKSQSKKKEKSYFEILYDYINSYDKAHENEPAPGQNEKRPYQLIEDIKIIYSVAQDDKHEGLGPVFWNELANKKIIQRPVESMRDRYKRYIRFLDKSDFDKIIQFLREQGTEGYMIFSKGDDGNRKLINIQLQDPSIKIDQQDQHSEGLPKPKDQKSLEMLRNIMQKKQEIKAKKQLAGKIEDKFFPIMSDSMTSNFKKIALQAARPIIKSNQTMLSSTLLEELPIMKSIQNQAAKSLECINQTSYKIHTNFQGQRYSTQQKITDIKDLNSVVNMLHFQFGKARQEIIEDLQSVNGNIQNLIQVYQHPAENTLLKWTPEDDDILQKCKTKDDMSLKLLVRYKGEESVRNRIKFKKFALTFTY